MRKAVLILISVLTGLATGGNNENSVNTCYTQNVVAQRGSSFSVGVYVNNSDTLGGMQIPIYYRSETVKLRCDSVTFYNSRCSAFSSIVHKIDPSGRTVYFVVVGSQGESLPPGDGLVATLWFTANDAAGSGKVELFSGPEAYLPEEKIDYNYLFWSPSARQINCRYKAGFITVR